MAPKNSTQTVEETARVVKADPAFFLIDKAIVDAYTLQKTGKISDAVEKWRSIANIVEGRKNETRI